MRFVIAFFVTMLVAAPVQARDETGTYMHYGARSCGKWVNAKEEDGWYWTVLQGWVAGYITAANLWIPGKYDWLEGSDLDGAMLWIDKYCNENPLSNTTDAMKILMRELGARR
jgi:hypothetical protein